MNQNISVLQNASSKDVVSYPYPHLVIENALPEEVFGSLLAQYPGLDVVANGRKIENSRYDYPAILAKANPQITPLWKKFVEYHTSEDFLYEFISLFGEHIDNLYPKLELVSKTKSREVDVATREVGGIDNEANLRPDIVLETQFFVNVTSQARKIRGPHVDRNSELFAGLFYFKDPQDDSIGGDLEIHEAIEPIKLYPEENKIRVDQLVPTEIVAEKSRRLQTISYKENTLVMFLNSNKSLHSVSPRSACSVPRRHMNLCGDVYLPEGLFQIEKV